MTTKMLKSDFKKIDSILRRRFRADRCAGWDSTIHIIFRDADNVTVNVKDGSIEILPGLRGKPLARIATDTKTLAGVIAGKIQFDIAAMQGELTTDNMIEAFKFVTVFEQDAYRGALNSTAAAKRLSPMLEGKKEAVAFLSRWAERAASDPGIRIRAVESGLHGSLAVRARKPDFVLKFDVSPDGFNIKCAAAAKKVDLETDAVNVHKVLCGAQNLMIGLNRKSIAGLRGPGTEGVLDLLIYLQPSLSRIYREMVAAT